MFEEILAENGTKFIVAAVVVLLGLLCLALVLWIVRGRPSSPFIRGGRNRAPRLAVLDAAAIDTRRRLVLVRRDDVEHLVMIGGPTDIVIESRIVGATAAASETARTEQAAERGEPVPARAVATGKEETTPVAARSAVASATVTGTAERRPAATPEGVSAMGKVLYGGKESRATQARTAAQPVTATRHIETATPQRTQERRAEDMLEQARQRVLATPTTTASGTATSGTTTSGQSGATATTGLRPVATAGLAKPAANAADNPALVSEFEKLLEAEISAASSAGTVGTARTAPLQGQQASQGGALAGQAQQPARSREETEAEMARLLGEISANRKG